MRRFNIEIFEYWSYAILPSFPQFTKRYWDQGHRFAKVYEREKYFFLGFAKVNVREKKLKTKIVIVFIYSKRQIWLN